MDGSGASAHMGSEETVHENKHPQCSAPEVPDVQNVVFVGD